MKHSVKTIPISKKCNSTVSSFTFPRDLTRRLVSHRWYVRDLGVKTVHAASAPNSLIVFLF